MENEKMEIRERENMETQEIEIKKFENKEPEKKVLLRTSAFGGFHKKDVLAYLKELDTAAAEKIADRDRKIEFLNNEIIELNLDRNEFQREKQALTAERELISQTLVIARETAEKLITDAKVEASKKQAEFAQNYNMEINKLATIRSEIIQLRKFATDAIRSFERELTTLERSTVE